MAVQIGPGSETFPEHLDIGLGKYINAQMQTQPNFAGINSMFSTLGSMGPFVRGGTFYNPQEAQQYATPGYLSDRGQIAQGNIQNMFNLANLALATGTARGTTAAMIPELQSQQIQAQMAGSPSSLFGSLF